VFRLISRRSRDRRVAIVVIVVAFVLGACGLEDATMPKAGVESGGGTQWPWEVYPPGSGDPAEMREIERTITPLAPTPTEHDDPVIWTPRPRHLSGNSRAETTESPTAAESPSTASASPSSRGGTDRPTTTATPTKTPRPTATKDPSTTPTATPTNEPDPTPTKTPCEGDGCDEPDPTPTETPCEGENCEGAD
jgi:cell division protein FtsN